MTKLHAVRGCSSLAAFAALSLLAACGAPTHKTANDSYAKFLGTQGADTREDLGGTRLSPSQVAYYLRNAGFPESAIGVMVCIAKYESSYYTGATNRNDNGTVDYGLFQINSYYWGDACGVSGSALLDPSVNARCALRVYRQQGYNAWYGYQYHRSECNATPAPGSSGPVGGTKKVSRTPNKLYSGLSKKSAFCSDIPVGTPVTIVGTHGGMYDVTIPSGKCVDWQGKVQTRGFLDASVVK